MLREFIAFFYFLDNLIENTDDNWKSVKKLSETSVFQLVKFPNVG